MEPFWAFSLLLFSLFLSSSQRRAPLACPADTSSPAKAYRRTDTLATQCYSCFIIAQTIAEIVMLCFCFAFFLQLFYKSTYESFKK